MIVPSAYEDFVNFIVSGLTPEAVLAYYPTPAASDRVEELAFKSKTDELRSNTLCVWPKPAHYSNEKYESLLPLDQQANISSRHDVDAVTKSNKEQL